MKYKLVEENNLLLIINTVLLDINIYININIDLKKHQKNIFFSIFFRDFVRTLSLLLNVFKLFK